MGNIRSKHVNEVLHGKASDRETPTRIRVLPHDPRSPSENVYRTPITVSSTSAVANETPTDNEKKQGVEVLSVDPRSPTTELTRTPIIIENESARQRHVPLRPSKLAALFNSSGEGTEDPRSPTCEVPRTPLDSTPKESWDSTDATEKTSSSGASGKADATIKSGSATEKEGQVDTRGAEDGLEKIRRPLGEVQNTDGAVQLQAVPQMKQYQSIEEEFSKAQQAILSQLAGQENSINTTTEFVENI